MQSRTLGWTLLFSVMATTVSFAQIQNRRAAINYGKLPMTFEANRGQTDPRVKFLSRGPGYTAFLTTGGLSLSLRAKNFMVKPASGNLSGVRPHEAAMLQFALVGAARNPEVEGENPQSGRVNYFFGNDPAKWRTNVPTYSRVRYKQVYPGIDLLYYGNQQQLEYDFELLPGADPRRIQFEIQGASQIKLDQEGTLIVRIGSKELHFQSPAVYQESDGQRMAVSGKYVVKDSSHIAFQVAGYDSSLTLVIDPVLVYSSYLGGSGNDQPTGIAVDSVGSVYVAGYTDSPDFPLATLGSLPRNTNHVFVTKLDPAGAHLIYADYIGGGSQDYGVALVLDSANNVYVTGSTESSNFPTVNPFQSQLPGPYSGFLTKVSADGASLLYSTYLGGNAFDQPTSLAIDGLRQVHVAGFTMSQNFPVANAYQATAAANEGGLYGDYGFLTKFSADGSSLIYSTYLSGNSNVAQDCGTPCWPTPYNAISALTVDANGNAYVAGTTNTYNFPTTSGAYLTNNSTDQDTSIGFVSKFNSAGGLGYSTYFYGSSGNPVGVSAIAVDGSGSAYVAGAVVSDGGFPVSSTNICDPAVDGFACSYTFVSKFDPAGSTLLYSTFLGPNNYAFPQSLVLDASNDAYVLASTSSSLFQTSNAIEAYTDQSDLLVVEIDPSATTQPFSTYLGGSGNESPAGMALDSNGNIYVAGATSSADIPATPGAFQSVLGGNTDAFVVKIGTASAPSVALSTTSLQFGSLPVGSTSQPQTILLRDLGSSSLSITSIVASGDFAESDNCANSVPATGSCTISVTFTPTGTGARSGSITINDDAAGSPHPITLSGAGSGASATLTPPSLTFAGSPVGVASATQTATLTNSGNASLSVTNIQITGDFAQTNNCRGSLAAASSCSITITFTPTATGTRTGTLTVTDGAQSSPQTVGLSGNGSDFSLSGSPTSATVKAGVTATYTMTIAPVGGAFANAVTLTCSGAPAHASCSVSPASVTPGSSSATATLTINTASSSADLVPLIPANNRNWYALLLPIPGFGLFGIMVAGSKRGAKKTSVLIALVLVVPALLFMSACAGGTGIVPTGQGTAPGTYTINVAATSGALQHSIPVTLTVQ
jgi:hypothetical protein